MKSCPACGLVFPDESNFCFLTGDTLEPMEDPLVGTSIAGRFRIEGLHRNSPWATVYRARERLLDTTCTLKLFSRLDDEQRPRFDHALERARRCTHDNVTDVLGGGVDEEGRAYVVHANLPEATPLSDRLAERKLELSQGVGMVVQVLRALGRIHDFGGLHGQLRPTNMLVTAAGHVELIDVGLNRLLVRDPWDDDETSLEPQHHQAPEIHSGKRASVPADLYSVGVLAHQLWTGRRPIEAEDTRTLRDGLAVDEGIVTSNTAPTLAPPIQQWLDRMLSRVPSKRPASAHQALDGLLEACEEAQVKPIPDPGPPASPEPQLDPSFARWQRFRAIFSKMIEIGFPNGAPDATKNSLSTLAGKAEDLDALAKKAEYEHGNLRDVLGRAREGRERIAGQMAELNEQAKEIHKELEPLLVAAERHGEKAKDFPEQAREQHREVLRWEGRSGFTEPYRELAEAYKELAAIIEKWWSVRSAQLSCEQDADEKNEQLRDLEQQIEELREALRVHESNLASEIASVEETLSSLGRQADELEMELLDLASRFSAPLRSKPELGGCFRELADA